MLLEVDDTELANLLVGLRLVAEWDNLLAHVTQPLGEHFHGLRRLCDREIDDLCERLNCPGEEIYLAWDADQFRVMGAAHRHVDAVAIAEEFDDVVVRPFRTGMTTRDVEDSSV